MAKFKVGDKVIGNKLADDYIITRCGWVGIVTYTNPKKCIHGDDIRVRAADDECGREFSVKSERFDLYRESKTQKIVITTDGKTTTAALYDGKKRIKDAKAIRSDDDAFDLMTGAKLALDRLSKPEKNPEKKGLNAIVYVIDVMISCYDEIKTGKVVRIINGRIEKTDLPCVGRIMNMDDLRYYFSSAMEMDSLYHTDPLSHFSRSGIKYKAMVIDDDDES